MIPDIDEELVKKRIAEDPDWANKYYSFEEGKELYLKVTVRNRIQSSNLITWLYNTKKIEVFGCTLEKISWNGVQSKEEWKKEMIELIEKL